jgi:hypothetical protein
MAQNPERIRQALDRYLRPDFRGRLRARGAARGMVWRDGVVPDGSPSFPDSLSADLLDFGYVVLALALELRDANVSRRPDEEHFRTNDAFEVAAEAIESAIRRGDPDHGDQGRHLVVAAAAFHLAGYAARSYSLLPEPALNRNLASSELALALLLRRDLLALRAFIIDWLARDDHSDAAVVRRLEDKEDSFGPEEAVLLALTTSYFKALGLADTALLSGERARYDTALQALRGLVSAAARVGNVPIWWVATLSIHLFRDLWDQSLHIRLPQGPSDALPPRWDELRADFIAQLAVRRPPHIDLWPSQLDAARRSVDPSDDLVIALPTSAGKTKIAELCILRALADEKRVVYVTPLRALSAQVERTLAQTFVPLGASVSSLYGAIGTSSADNETLADANVVVATPEKLDFALRQDPDVLDDVGLIVLDEGHMIGLGSREIRYEVLIQRVLRRADAHDRRIVCLSAMFNPKEDEHFRDFGSWLRSDVAGEPVHVEWRPTRRRLAVLDWFGQAGSAKLSFLEDEAPYVTRFVERQPPHKPRRTPFPSNEVELCIAAADAFARDGHAVLVYSPQRSQIDLIVRTFTQAKRQGYLEHVKTPDPADLTTALAIGREWLGASHTAVEALAIGVGTHHGALPRPFQSAVEELLDKKRLAVVVASPTLAQGVDLSCSVLIFRALTRFDPATKRPAPITPAEFSNVVGRAGRAYVDLDGIVMLPSFEGGTARNNRHALFGDLIEKSRKQRLRSGLAILLLELAEHICAKLGVKPEALLEYVLNNGGLWTDERLTAPEALDEDDDQAKRSFDEYVADLDVALLALVDRLDSPVDELASILDEILKDSLWRRTLDHVKKEVRSFERAIIVSRAQWLWSNTSAEQRRACFSSGLGARAGTFLFDHLDELVGILADLQTAIAAQEDDQIAALAVRFAEEVTADPFFAVRRPPDNWRDVLRAWVKGTAFADILQGLGLREEQRTQAFVQDGVVFRLVWAAEAVRVQAASTAHARAEELRDGPMLTLTHGVPCVPAAILCQAGYPSRVGALWLVRTLPATFTDFEGMREWMRATESTTAKDDFWEGPDHRVLWARVSAPTRTDAPRRWRRLTLVLSPRWTTRVPAPGTFVRVLPTGRRSVVLCSDALVSLGTADLPLDPRGALLDADVLSEELLRIRYFGP